MTVTIAIRHEKAMHLLQDLADLNLIEFVSSTASATDSTKRKLSSFIGKIQTGQTVDQLEEQLGHLRDEWDRAI